MRAFLGGLGSSIAGLIMGGMPISMMPEYLRIKSHPRKPGGVRRSRYMPHQGAQEIARRKRQIEARKFKIVD